MLRHYDAIGLLRPAHVDQMTGYRSYDAGQLSRLNRIVALKDLGFTLQQVRSILDDEVSVEELRGMLRLREAELQSQIAADTARLARVEARLRTIEKEGAMPADEVQIKRIPGVRVAELSATAAGFEPGSAGPGWPLSARTSPTTRTPRTATGSLSTPLSRSTPISVRTSTSRSLTCPRSSRGPRSCTAVRWTT
jgi:DNA-binding transcriptional MerR regulator